MGHTIVLGLDGSRGSKAAARWCAELAATLHADVIAVHGLALDAYPYFWMPLPTIDETWHKELLATMEREWCEPLEAAGVSFKAEVVEADPAQAIMQVADRAQAYMIVVGKRGRGPFTEALLGSVSHRLAHHSGQPVIIIPSKDGKQRH